MRLPSIAMALAVNELMKAGKIEFMPKINKIPKTIASVVKIVLSLRPAR